MNKCDLEKNLPANHRKIDDGKYEIPTEDPRVLINLVHNITAQCVLIDSNSGKIVSTSNVIQHANEIQQCIDDLKKEIKLLKFCQACGSVMILRDGKFGAFYSCSRYPLCMTKMNANGKFNDKSGTVNGIVLCPKCDAPMRKISGSRGEFYGCSEYKNGCRGTRKVSDVEIYEKGVEQVEQEEITTIDIKHSNIVQERNQIIDIPQDDSNVELIPTSQYPFLKFKFDNFNPVQSRVFKYYDQDINCVVAASTSAGKTAVAEMFMAHSISQGKKAIFLSPLKAVSQEKYDEWKDRFENVSIVTGDYALSTSRVEELNNANVIVMTTEMLDSHTRRIFTEKNDWLLKTGTVVCDECFLRNTQILLEKNISASIEDVYNNENIQYVLSYNEGKKVLEKKKILRKIRKEKNGGLVNVQYITENKKYNIICTPNHKLWTSSGYKRADELRQGDILKIFQKDKNDFKCDYLTDDDLRNDEWENTKKIIQTFIYNHDGIVLNVKGYGNGNTENIKYVYNLEIEDNHNYIANNVLVSNCHMISMEGRGDKVESAIMRFTKQNPTCRIVFLSATMKNVSELAKWLSFLNGKKTELINSAYRPIELGIHYETYKDKGRYAAVEENKIQKTLELIDSKRDEQFLIFVHAKATGRIIKERLEEIYGKKRVDFHYSELNLKDRLEIERKTKTKEIQFLVATSTLAFGINI